KPAFRAALKYRRCIISADGLFEWQKSVESNAKTPYWIHRHNRKPFALAGLWESWNKDGSGPLETCTILTTHANAMMSMLHDRMPVILEPKDFDRWLNTPPEQARELTSLFHPAPDDYLEAWPVSKAVNSPANQGPELIEPA
ncbi:MAG: SOS response-associated peptidase, partial [bacterium]